MSLWRGWVLLIWTLDYLTWTNALVNEEGESQSDAGPLQTVLPEDVLGYDADWKRSHNIMRFGKRSSTKSEFDIDAEKRGGDSSKHNFMYFGKRPDPDSTFPDLLQYLRANQEKDSWKRGHNIMRFGKRKDNHNFIHFGKRTYDPSNLYDLLQSHLPDRSDLNDPEGNTEEKRTHSMMYFGKRGGHAMMYFGKRGGHSLLHFGKRSSGEVEDSSDAEKGRSLHMEGGGSYPESENEKRNSHNIIRFGKRSDDEIMKRAHAIIHFGKRFGDSKKAHSMIHFGKRDHTDDTYNDMSENQETYGDVDAGDNTKRAPHSMIHFGKRYDSPYEGNPIEGEEYLGEVTSKRAPHAMIHFGKRGDAETGETVLASPDSSTSKRYHSALHFGKRLDEQEPPIYGDINNAEDKRNHAMIHFGKRYESSRGSHAMIHFGKRNLGDDEDTTRHVNKRSSTKDWPYNGFYHTPAISEANSIESNGVQLDNSTLTTANISPNKVSKINETTRHKRETISMEEPLASSFPLSGYNFVVKMQPKPEFSDGLTPLDDRIENIDHSEMFDIGTKHDYQFMPSRQIRSDFLSELINYRRPYKKENAKNVFLHFGKR